MSELNGSQPTTPPPQAQVTEIIDLKALKPKYSIGDQAFIVRVDNGIPSVARGTVNGLVFDPRFSAFLYTFLPATGQVQWIHERNIADTLDAAVVLVQAYGDSVRQNISNAVVHAIDVAKTRSWE